MNIYIYCIYIYSPIKVMILLEKNTVYSDYDSDWCVC